MEYKYEKHPQNSEDYASGRVLWNAPGTTAFPVRLASELYLRAKAYLLQKSSKEKITIYDPCCGGAYLLTTLGIMHGQDLDRLIGSDIDPRAVELAKRNLSLVNADGINRRIEQITRMIREFGKESHRQALESALRLKDKIVRRNAEIDTCCFAADAVRGIPLDSLVKEVDLVITDVPYGQTVHWIHEGETEHPLVKLLDNLRPVLSPASVVVIVADKKQTVSHPNFRPLERFKAGKRQVTFLEL
mgnify:CR=1 FL=1